MSAEPRRTGVARSLAAGPGCGQRIRGALARGRAVGVRELSRILGLDESELRERLDELVQRGEAERLRPVAYPRDDMDFYRLLRRDEQARLQPV